MKRLAAEVGVDFVDADQCMYGLKTRGEKPAILVPAKKPSTFTSNSRAIIKELQKKCDGTHPHQPLVDGRVAEAARYPEGLCRAICRGIVEEKRQRNLQIRAVKGISKGYYPRPNGRHIP